MRRLVIILLSILMLSALCFPAMGANHASKVAIQATVGSDKSCQVTVNVTMHIDENADNLTFPIPLEATDVTLEGDKVKLGKTKQAQLVALSDIIGNMTGDLAFTIQYTLPNVIGTDDAGQPEMQLPLLSGFINPISQLDFTVTLPGEVEEKAAFSSGYHHADIEKELQSTNKGNAVVGCSLSELKDHETLTMYLPVKESWFPDAPLQFLESDADDIAMIICGVLALLYWLVFLRFLPPKRKLSPTVPEGLTAGHIGAALTLGKADLSLMVFSWAQMGYLQIQSGSKRVLLHKIMDMGNERSAFEQRCFKKLFGKNTTVNASSLAYAYKCADVKKLRPNLSFLVQPRSGNTLLFRLLCGLIALFGGISFGVALTQDLNVQGIWIFLTAVTGLVCGWFMQSPMGELFLRKTGKTIAGIICGIIWMILGICAGQAGIAIAVLISQLLAGWMAFYGGLRTDFGSQEFARILGLRQFLKTASREDIRRIQGMDPEYFHTLAPYAMALGVSHSFAKRFGKEHIPTCPYITCKAEKYHTAKQWIQKMERTLNSMDRLRRRLPLERLRNILNAVKG